MIHESAPNSGEPPAPTTRRKRVVGAVWLVVHTLQVRLRFIIILAAAFIVAGQWDTLRNYWDRMTRDLVGIQGASRMVSPNTEYFCPMDPVVISMRPGKCDICNMALVRRQVGDMPPSPSGVLARMQISPYRVQLAGIKTAPADYQPTSREVTVTGIVREDGLVQCRISEHERPFVVSGLAVEITIADGAKQPSVRGKLKTVDVDPRESRAIALIRFEESPPSFPSGTRVLAMVHRPIADLEPFRSLPSNPPPLVKGEPLAVFVCTLHPEVLMTERGRCPIDRENELQRQGLLDGQRVRWWCPMHPNVTADRARELCKTCGDMKLVPRIVTYRPPGQVLTVPASAVVDTGTRAVVFVEQMPGLFDSVEVVVGPRCGDVYPVASGLEPRQRVVINGAFLLDAETQLNPSLAASYFGATRTASNEPTSRSTSKLIDLEQVTCPVTGKPLGSMGPPVSVSVNGQTVQLCCKACEERLRKSPDKYLSKPKPQ